MISWDQYIIWAIYFPLQIGYRYNKFELSGGIIYNAYTFTPSTIRWYDPAFASYDPYEYYDLHSSLKKRWGINFSLCFDLKHGLKSFIDLRSVKTMRYTNRDDQFNYAVISIGLKYRFIKFR